MAGAFGGGLYEHIVLTPLWSASPPSSFSIIQPRMGVPRQRFWIPVHAAITIFIVLAQSDQVTVELMQAGRDRVVRDALPGLTTGIAVLQAVLAVVHVTLGSAAERSFVVLDVASAALAAGLRYALGKRALPERWAHPFAVGCGALACWSCSSTCACSAILSRA